MANKALPSTLIDVDSSDPSEPTVAALLQQAEAYAYGLYPPQSVHMLPVNELTKPHVRFLVARDPDTREALGCCAVVLQDAACAEIKRMFVQAPSSMRAALRSGDAKTARRRGIGAALMQSAEDVARSAQVQTLRFETGPEQPHAIALGHRFGYQLRGPYGDYPEDPNSVFMEKRLDPV